MKSVNHTTQHCSCETLLI